MNARFGRIMRQALGLTRTAGQDLGTVCLGASAILLSRVFPSFVCSECTDYDLAMLIASVGFLSVGMVMRYLGQDTRGTGNQGRDGADRDNDG